jgi:hypothetical protein
MSNIMHLLFTLQEDNVKAEKIIKKIKDIVNNKELFAIEKMAEIEEIIMPS